MRLYLNLSGFLSKNSMIEFSPQQKNIPKLTSANEQQKLEPYSVNHSEILQVPSVEYTVVKTGKTHGATEANQGATFYSKNRVWAKLRTFTTAAKSETCMHM